MAQVTADIVTWQVEAEAELLGLQNDDGGWPYNADAAIAGRNSCTEATALAMLALGEADDANEATGRSAAWLLARQRDDGLFPAMIGHDEASWLAPLAALALLQRGQVDAAAASADALLALPTYTFTFPLPGIYGYDTEISGWPWTVGDFSFVEPTSLAMIFLKRAGRDGDPRVAEGTRFLRDRALATGGWNYGEPQVLGSDLFPSLAHTALALLALADEQDDQTAAGLAWLRTQREQATGLLSLGWSAIALNVYGTLDDTWCQTVIARWANASSTRRGPMETALCLLALGDQMPHPLGVTG